jgi:hypothetical protein
MTKKINRVNLDQQFKRLFLNFHPRLWGHDKFIERIKKKLQDLLLIYLILKVEIKKQLKPRDQYITQHKKKIKKLYKA